MHLFSGHAVLIVDELGLPAEDAASLFQVISRRYQKGSTILTATAASPPGETSSQTAPSLRPCWTGYCTEASCSPFRETATGYASTKPKPENTDRKEAPARLSNTPRVGNFDDQLWGSPTRAWRES